MGYFSELDILLDTLPRDREDPIFAKKHKKQPLPQYESGEFSLWDLTDEELLVFVEGKTTNDMITNIINRLAVEKKTVQRPIVYQKNRG